MRDSENFYVHYKDWKSWDNMFVYTSDHAGYFATELADLKIEGADVLEIGFGSGNCVAWMEERGARVSVTEIDERSCEIALERGLNVLPADLPLAAIDYTQRFDTIIAFDVFEHMDFDLIGQYLNACATMLKPRGRLLLRFPNSQSPFGLVPQAGDPTHKSELSLSVMKLLIMDRPYRIVRYEGAYLYLGKLMSFVWVKRFIRRTLQRVLNGILHFIYASGIPYEPVVVIVLEKDESGLQN